MTSKDFWISSMLQFINRKVYCLLSFLRKYFFHQWPCIDIFNGITSSSAICSNIIVSDMNIAAYSCHLFICCAQMKKVKLLIRYRFCFVFLICSHTVHSLAFSGNNNKKTQMNNNFIANGILFIFLTFIFLLIYRRHNKIKEKFALNQIKS